MLSIESFLADFSRVAARRIPDELLDSRRREIRNHLESSAKEVGEIEAVRRFGSPRQLANSLVRSHRGYQNANAARLSRGPGTILFLGLSVPFLWAHILTNESQAFSSYQLLWKAGLLLALGVFTIKAFVTRRWLVIPSAMWCAAAFAAMLAGSALIDVISPPRDSYEWALRRSKEQAEAWHSLDEGVVAWRGGQPADQWLPPISPSIVRETGSFAPQGYGITKLDGGIFPGPGDGPAEWKRYGNSWAALVADQSRMANIKLHGITEMRLPPPNMSPLLLSVLSWTTGTVTCLIYLIGLNGLALGFGYLNDRKNQRRV